MSSCGSLLLVEEEQPQAILISLCIHATQVDDTGQPMEGRMWDLHGAQHDFQVSSDPASLNKILPV